MPVRSAARPSATEEKSSGFKSLRARPGRRRTRLRLRLPVIPTARASGALSRKAKPRASAMAMGKTKTQNIASGSRTNSRRRVRTSSTSAGSGRLGLLIAQLPPGQRRGRRLRASRGASRAPRASRPDVFERQEQRRDRLDEGPTATDQWLPRGRGSSAPGIAATSAGTPGVGGELEDVRALQAADELRRRSLRDDPAVVHDRDAVAEALGLFHVVGRQEDRSAAARKAWMRSQSCRRLCGSRPVVGSSRKRISGFRSARRRPPASGAGLRRASRPARRASPRARGRAALPRGRARRGRTSGRGASVSKTVSLSWNRLS